MLRNIKDRFDDEYGFGDNSGFRQVQDYVYHRFLDHRRLVGERRRGIHGKHRKAISFSLPEYADMYQTS